VIYVLWGGGGGGGGERNVVSFMVVSVRNTSTTATL